MDKVDEKTDHRHLSERALVMAFLAAFLYTLWKKFFPIQQMLYSSVMEDLFGMCKDLSSLELFLAVLRGSCVIFHLCFLNRKSWKAHNPL